MTEPGPAAFWPSDDLFIAPHLVEPLNCKTQLTGPLLRTLIGPKITELMILGGVASVVGSLLHRGA